MTYTELRRMTAGRFSKVVETENSIVIGTLGSLNEQNTTYEVIIHLARIYNINTEVGIFKYHFITQEGAIKKGCTLPVNNYNQFIEFFK